MDRFTFSRSVVDGTLIHTFSWLFATVALKRFKAITWWLVPKPAPSQPPAHWAVAFSGRCWQSTGPDGMASVCPVVRLFCRSRRAGHVFLTATMFIGLASSFYGRAGP